jgi:uncharacterized membrane protein YkgB
MKEPKSAAQKARAWHLNALETVLLIGIVELIVTIGILLWWSGMV